MRKLFFVIAMTCLVCSVSFAETATLDLYAGQDWTVISLPQVPLDSNVETLLPDASYYSVGNLMRFDATIGSYVTYPSPNFGGMLLGEGYFFYNYNDATTVSYDAVENGVPSVVNSQSVKTDMWISLPGVKETPTNDNAGGWHLIGNPYADSVPVSNISFTNGTDVKDWAGAIGEGWVDTNMLAYVGGTYQYVQYDQSTATITPGYGYWLYTFVDDIAMIIKAP